MSPRAWLMQNGPFLIVCVVALVYVYRSFGPLGLLQITKTALGLGFIIFIHELGHFLAAKWCDVHVVTFSIGFGPSLPGCNFTRGETNYKLALLPLGGYVHMIGEGPEADEDEEYPRSFKNKTVGQRMLIISAGVIMNILFGAAVFIAVFLTAGLERQTAIIGRVEPGMPAWDAGVHAGWKLTGIGNREKPWFDHVRRDVALSWGGPITFRFVDPQGNEHAIDIEPRRDLNVSNPVIGVAAQHRLQLIPGRYRREVSSPVLLSSAAAHARVLDLGKDDVPAAASDPEKAGEVTPLSKKPSEAWQELCSRMRKMAGKPVVLEVRRGGATETERITVPAEGFDFDDLVVGTTDPAAPDRPFQTIPLPPDPHTGAGKDFPDPMEFSRRMTALEGRPAVIQVRRAREGKSEEVVNLLVPPAYHASLGLRMKMGKVAAVRTGSPAEKAELRPFDTIKGVKLVFGNEQVELDENALDPVRLPWELEHRVRARGKNAARTRVILTVTGQDQHKANAERTLEPMEWDDSYSLAGELPVSRSAPVSIPQLGIAYWAESVVQSVAKGGPADKAGLQKNDEILEVSFRERTADDSKVTWGPWIRLVSKRAQGVEVKDQWGYVFWRLQNSDYHQVRFKLQRGGKAETLEFPAGEASPPPGITAEPDTTWPMADRGFLFRADTRRQKAASVPEAILYGLDYTLETIQQIYLTLSSLLSRRISHENLGGPIEIAKQGFNFAGEDAPTFFAFLAMISINLAVVNFLPIPVLDGGHMVFLIYEKIRGRPPSETVRIVATYIGLAMLLALMVFVFWLDIKRNWASFFRMFTGR